MNDNLKETVMLDFSSANVKSLVKQRGWNHLDEKEKVVEIYNFVKDEILFGYNVSDNIPASKVLQDATDSATPRARCLWHFCALATSSVAYIAFTSIKFCKRAQ